MELVVNITNFQYNNYDIGVSFFPAVVLRGIPYQNNSNVILEDIGQGDDALLVGVVTPSSRV